MNTRLVLSLIAAVLLSSLGVWRYNATANSATATKPAISPLAVKGETLTRLSFPDLNGKPQALAQWHGKVLVINYWATWCVPCRDEMPAFSRLQQVHAGSGVQFVGLSIDDADKVREFQKKTPVGYPLLIAEPSAIALTETLGNAAQGLPFTVVIDRKGQIAATRLGRFKEDELDAVLRGL